MVRLQCESKSLVRK